MIEEGMEESFYFRARTDECQIPETVLWILQELGERNQETPLFVSVDRG